MASKIQSHNFYVAITPYKVESSSADEFNLLNVRTAYDDRRKYFYVDLHAGWNTGWGGFGCILMGADDPLTGPKYVKVKDAPKNSQKTINEMGANLEQAKDAIAWLFDHREWAKLYLAVGNIARNGYTEDYRKQMEELINSNNNQNKEDENMRLNINNNESANVQNNAQVNNNAAAIEDVNVGEVTVDSIMPVMQPVEEKPAVTVPLDSHGTLVVGGVTKPERITNADTQGDGIANPAERKRKVQDSVPQAGKYQYVTYDVKKVNKTTKKEYTVTGSKIVGFELTDPIYLAGPAFCGAISTESVDGKTVGALRFSHKWTPAVKDVCDLLNSGKATLEGCVAIINGAKAERSERIQERIAKREERKAQKSEKGTVKAAIEREQCHACMSNAEREQARPQVKSEESATAQAAAPAMSDEDAAMFDLFKRFMAGDKDAMAKVGAVLQAA